MSKMSYWAALIFINLTSYCLTKAAFPNDDNIRIICYYILVITSCLFLLPYYNEKKKD